MHKDFVRYILLMTFTILFISCSSSGEKFDKENFVNKMKRLPPGTVQICATVQSINTNSDYLITEIRIDTVFNYGQSTRPLVTNNNLVVNIPNSFFDSSKENGLLELNKIVYLELKSQKNISLNNKKKNKWLVSKFALNNIFK